MTSLRQWLPAVALLTLGLTGCGGSEPVVTKSLLRGTATFDGKPLVIGLVTAYKGGTKVMETNINPDGFYQFAQPSTGEYQLTVTNTDAPTPYGKPVKLPAKYADPAKSGLTAKVTNDETNTQDLVLTSK